MIITCASCLTKYHLDDSKISPKGSKVRCSRCQHLFYVVSPPETKEEIVEDFESFAKYHEELMGPEQKGMEISPIEEGEEEKFLFAEKLQTEKIEPVYPPELPKEEGAETKVIPPKSMMEEAKRFRIERRGPSRFLALVAIIILLVFGLFFLWTEMESGGKLSSLLEYPIKKITDLWNEIWGTGLREII